MVGLFGNCECGAEFIAHKCMGEWGLICEPCAKDVMAEAAAIDEAYEKASLMAALEADAMFGVKVRY